MICPFCNETMIDGTLFSEASHAVYWLPSPLDHSDIKSFILTKKSVEGVGGIVLDKISKIGFFATDNPTSYYCKVCNLYITKYEE